MQDFIVVESSGLGDSLQSPLFWETLSNGCKYS